MGGKEGGASGAEEGALAAGVGVPGKDLCAVGEGEMGDVARGVVRDAVGGEENGAGVGNDKGGRGGTRGGAIAEATEVDGKLEEALGVGGEGGAGEFFEEFEGGVVEGCGERGGPEEGVEGIGQG
jgi:hypothetical protein